MKLYIGNLDFGTTDDSLRDLFAEFGEVVSARVIIDRDTGRSRGFGFVEMSGKPEGIKAISNLDGREFNGRNLKVNEAQERPAGGGNRSNRW